LSIKLSKKDRDTLQKLADGFEYEECEVIAGRNGKPEKAVQAPMLEDLQLYSNTQGAGSVAGG
jgi:hypothetical protein